VAAANQVDHLVLSTGEETERFAMARFTLPLIAFVEMGIFTGDCVRRAARKGIRRVTICGMIGKLAKVAAGQLQTHVAAGVVDPVLLADIARAVDLPSDLAENIAHANTARHAQELVVQHGSRGGRDFFSEICRRAATECRNHTRGSIDVTVILFDAEGQALGEATSEG
jgi:cobalt-precorrin-5B (C1)-methyltransferase